MTVQPTAAGRQGPVRFHYAYVIVILATLSVLGSQGFLRFGYAMILPSMREAMGLNFAQTGMLATANYLGYVAVASLIGLFISRLGFRLTIGIGSAVVGVAMFLTGTARTYEVALALQAVAGGASALAISPAMSLSAPWFAPRRRGLAAGAISSGGPLGSLVTGPIMPLFILGFGAAGWRYGWFALGATVVAIGVLNLLFLRNRPEEVGLAPLGSSGEPGRSSGRTASDWRSVYRIPLVWYLAGLGFLSTLSAISFNTFFTVYLVGERGLTTAAAGQLWALSGAMGIVGGFLWGGVSDRAGRKPALIGAYGVQALCFSLFALGGGIPVFALCAFLYGITARANFTVIAAFCGDLLGSRLAAAAFGINGVMAGLGMAIGPYVAGAITDVTSSFTYAFWASAAIAAVGALAAAGLRDQPLPGSATD